MLGPRPLEGRGLTVRDRTLIGDEHFDDDEYPLQAAGDYNQMIEMQQMSCALAKDVLDSSSLKPTWSWNATQESFIHERADFTASAGNSSTFDNGSYAEILSQQQQGENLAQHDSPQEHWKATEELSAHTSARNATTQQGRYTTARTRVSQPRLSVGSDGEGVRRRDSQQGSHSAEESDVQSEFGQSFVANEGSSSRADTRTYPHVSPQDQGERLVRDDQPQGNISHESSSTSDSREAMHDDRSKAAPSTKSATRESSTSALSFPEPDHVSDAERTALQDDRSLPLEGATSTSWRSNVSLSQNVLPPPRSNSPGSDTIWRPEEQSLREEGMLSQETVERGTREDDRLDRIERFLTAQVLANNKKAEAAAAARREAAAEAAEARKRGDEDKLRKLESLILAQKDEQLKREVAADTARAAEKAAADAEAKMIAKEKKARAAIELARKMSVPITFHDPIGRKFTCPWHECSTREVSVY